MRTMEERDWRAKKKQHIGSEGSNKNSEGCCNGGRYNPVLAIALCVCVYVLYLLYCCMRPAAALTDGGAFLTTAYPVPNS